MSQPHRSDPGLRPPTDGGGTGPARPADPAAAPAATVTARAVVPTALPDPATDPIQELVSTAESHLAAPGLVVLTGPPGAGRSSVLRRLATSFRGPVFAGGALAMLRGVPALPLSRAVRVRLPVHDPALLAEAVRSRVRAGLLLLDDLQWADPLTVATLPALAEHCRIVVTLRTPHRLPGDTEQLLRAASAAWLALPPLPAEAAIALVRQLAPGAAPAAIADVVRRAGGIPLALTSLGRHLAAHRDAPAAADPTTQDDTALAYAVAAAIADLARPARTAMAALGLLGRPAAPGLLGDGVADLLTAGLVELVDSVIAAVSPYVAEVAAGLLSPDERAALHRRLADFVPPREAARHLAAAGDNSAAYTLAVAAADATDSSGERAELLLLACALPGVMVDAAVRVAAGRAALVAGRPNACLRALGADPAPGEEPAAAVLRGEALLQIGSVAAAVRAVAGVPDDAPPDTLGARDRVRLLGLLAAGPPGGAEFATGGPGGDALAAVLAAHGDPPVHLGLRAAVAAARAAQRQPGWERALAGAAAAAGTGGDALAARWSAWLLVETLSADGRLTEAVKAAQAAAVACAADLAYSWQTRFLAAALWCTALRGDETGDVVRRATDLIDRTLPVIARGYAAAAASLSEADGGLLASARSRLSSAGAQPASTAALLDWVAREAAWLDGQPELATAPPDASAPPLVDGLRRITARWAAYETGAEAQADGDSQPLPQVRDTLAAWTDPKRFDAAAAGWHDLARREEVRCLLAFGVLSTDPAEAVPPLLRAEQLAEESGLVVLLGRAHRALRRHAVRRDARGRRSGDELTDRERDVLRLVARGEPTRRIAGQLGISRETVETHIRAGMRKLGARTRTEAAALALEVLG